MNYTERKKRIIEQRNLLLKQYLKLYRSSLQLAKEISKLEHEPMKYNEKLDWLRFSTSDKDMIKLTRLIISLLYVEDPQNKEIISSLKDNININYTKSYNKK